MNLDFGWHLPWSRRKGAAPEQGTESIYGLLSPGPVAVLEGDCSGAAAAPEDGVQGLIALLSKVPAADHATDGNEGTLSPARSSVAVLAGLDLGPSGESNRRPAGLLVSQPVSAEAKSLEDRPAKPPAEAPSGATSTKHAALLVEGDAVHALVLGRLLRVCGYEVQLADSQFGAVEAFRRAPFGLVLIDCDTPEIDGYKIAATLRRAQRDEGGTPLVALTSGTSAEMKAKRKGAGFDNYLEKPVRLEKLNVLLARYDLPCSESCQVRFPAIDKGELALLCQLKCDSEEFLRQFVRVFLVDAHQHLDEIRTAVEEGRRSVVARHARALATLSRQIGAASMQKECEAIGAAAFSASVAAMSAMLSDLSLALERVGADLRDAEANLLPAPSGDSDSRAATSWNGGPTQPQRASRVLLAERNAFQAQFLATSLSVAGHDVYRASTGKEALKLFREVAVDVAILDANTPEGDGYFVLNELRMDPKLKRLPVMILSDRYREQEVLRAFELGADDYVPKPFNPLEVTARVRSLLRRL